MKKESNIYGIGKGLAKKLEIPSKYINQLNLSNICKNINLKNNQYVDDQKNKEVETSFKKGLKNETNNELIIKKIINEKQNSPYKYTAYNEIKNKQSINKLYKNQNKIYKINDRDNNLYTPKKERKISHANLNDINILKNKTIYIFKRNKNMINNYQKKNTSNNRNNILNNFNNLSNYLKKLYKNNPVMNNDSNDDIEDNDNDSDDIHKAHNYKNII